MSEIGDLGSLETRDIREIGDLGDTDIANHLKSLEASIKAEKNMTDEERAHRQLLADEQFAKSIAQGYNQTQETILNSIKQTVNNETL